MFYLKNKFRGSSYFNLSSAWMLKIFLNCSIHNVSFLIYVFKLDSNFLSLSPCLAIIYSWSNKSLLLVGQFLWNKWHCCYPQLVKTKSKKSVLVSLKLLYGRVFVVLSSSYFGLIMKDIIRCMFKSYRERDCYCEKKFSISSSIK